MRFPNESTEYRAARNALLASETALRRQMEVVAAELRALPPGGEIPEDYVFDAMDNESVATVVRMSELFRGGDTLMMYHYICLLYTSDAADERSSVDLGGRRI